MRVVQTSQAVPPIRTRPTTEPAGRTRPRLASQIMTSEPSGWPSVDADEFVQMSYARLKAPSLGRSVIHVELMRSSSSTRIGSGPRRVPVPQWQPEKIDGNAAGGPPVGRSNEARVIRHDLPSTRMHCLAEEFHSFCCTMNRPFATVTVPNGSHVLTTSASTHPGCRTVATRPTVTRHRWAALGRNDLTIATIARPSWCTVALLGRVAAGP